MARETSDFNKTPSANRVHISFFGRRNAGKSSVVNAVTGQKLAIVSPVKGTTTDPVKKAMELLPLGPVVIIDTPGIDDEGTLGEKRIEKTYQILNKTDAAVLVVDVTAGLCADDETLIGMFRARQIPFVVAFNKADLSGFGGFGDGSFSSSAGGGFGGSESWRNEDVSTNFAQPKQSKQPKQFTHTIPPGQPADPNERDFPWVLVSAVDGTGIKELKETIASIAKNTENHKKLLSDKLSPSDIVVLVTPIDSSAPKGRMILPQVQTIRDILDAHACCITTQAEELPACLAALNRPPALVVTDSQVFDTVKGIVPEGVSLTSFSILFARFKGILDSAVFGADKLSSLPAGSKILIAEGCTHHRQCEDIGTVKLPGWIEKYAGKNFDFEFTSGGDFPMDLEKYGLIVHCGGCMLGEREMIYRMNNAAAKNVPFTNYGTLIAKINGILDRSVAWLK